MTDTATLQLAQRGVLTLPKSFRDRYHLKSGDVLTLLDLGGVLVLSPKVSEIDYLADRMKKRLSKKGETLESMLQALRRERDKHARRG